ncbi:MAG TPA: 6,7-dimethyl-8-ribityllumazine synthase, partial [Dehalococcoidia bacterium]|nr:6,7-dimethyl-8-ribityllumazine synthase [Dehalococcoidia bacterium]
RFNDFVTSRLLEGAREAAAGLGVAADAIDIVWTPGCFELPVVAKALASSGRYDAIVCLGAVIRGETPHFDYVAGQAAEGIQRVALDTGVPCAFGVITANTVEQALARAGGRKGNKGYDAVVTAVETVNALRALGAK